MRIKQEPLVFHMASPLALQFYKILIAPTDDQDRLLRSWYNAALYFLDRADYMRYPDIRSVQAIAILGMCFANFGDTNRYMLMWSCAIRIAQKLGLHEQGTLNRTCLGRAHSSRLWWTLIICEWSVILRASRWFPLTKS